MDSQIKILGPDGVKRIYKNIYSSVERFQNNTLKDINDFKSAAQTDISAAIQNAISVIHWKRLITAFTFSADLQKRKLNLRSVNWNE